MKVKDGSRNVVLLRHGETGYSEKYLGATDVGLAEEGRLQILRLRKTLDISCFSRVYCSPLKRCRQTAGLLGVSTPIYSDEIREIDFGRWELKDAAILARESPELLDSWAGDPEGFHFPGGESVREFRQRVSHFYMNILTEPAENILIIAHGGSIRTLLCCGLEYPFDRDYVFRVIPGTYSRLRLHQAGAVLEGLNLGG